MLLMRRFIDVYFVRPFAENRFRDAQLGVGARFVLRAYLFWSVLIASHLRTKLGL